MAKRQRLVCCVLCGRDTRTRDAICSRCRGGSRLPWGHGGPEQIGRKVNRVQFAESPIIYSTGGKSRLTTFERYHGPTIRDDI